MNDSYELLPPDSHYEHRRNLIQQALSEYQRAHAKNLYKTLCDRFKKKDNPRVLEYSLVTQDHFKKLLKNVEARYERKVEFLLFPETKKHEELAAYFVRYILLLILYPIGHMEAVVDFFEFSKDNFYKDGQHNNLVSSHNRTLEQVRGHAGRYFSRLKKNSPDIYNHLDLSNRIEQRLADDLSPEHYGIIPPVEFFSQRDAQELERLLRKLMHSDCFLCAGKEWKAKFKKGRGGVLDDILENSRGYTYDFFTVFKTLGLTNSDCAKYTEICLRLLYACVKDELAYTGVSDTFVYKASTIMQNIKVDEHFNVDFKNAPLETLIPKIGRGSKTS